MAKINNLDDFFDDEGMVLWNAASLFLFGITERFQFNRNRYNNNIIYPHISSLCKMNDDLLDLIHSYRTLYTHYKETNNHHLLYGLILLFHKIDSIIYVIHHTLLELDTKKIVKSIRIIDRNKIYWNIDKLNDINSLPDLSKTEISIRDMFELKKEIDSLAIEND